jgi:hypothetical protein
LLGEAKSAGIEIGDDFILIIAKSLYISRGLLVNSVIKCALHWGKIGALGLRLAAFLFLLLLNRSSSRGL